MPQEWERAVTNPTWRQSSVWHHTPAEEMDIISDESFNDDKIGATLDNLKYLKESLQNLKDLNDPINTDEKEVFVDKVEMVIKSLLEIRELLMSDVRNFLTSRQYDILTMEEDTFIMDPSIQFFGLDWTLLTSRLKIMENKLLSYMKNLQLKRMEVMTLASILKIISQTSTELHQHSIAVVLPKKNEKPLKNIKINVIPRDSKQGLRKMETTPLEKGHCFSERLRRKSFNFNQTLGVSIQHSLRRRPSQVPRNNLSPEDHWVVPRRKTSDLLSKEKESPNVV